MRRAFCHASGSAVIIEDASSTGAGRVGIGGMLNLPGAAFNTSSRGGLPIGGGGCNAGASGGVRDHPYGTGPYHIGGGFLANGSGDGRLADADDG